MITVVNKYKFKGPSVYIGRPSALGNPFVIGADGTRAEVIEQYRDFMIQSYIYNAKYRSVIDTLVSAAARGEDINLSCFCSPQACHGDVIKEMIEGIVEGIKE